MLRTAIEAPDSRSRMRRTLLALLTVTSCCTTLPVAAQNPGLLRDLNAEDETGFLRNSLPEQFQLDNGATGYRIVGGRPAPAGAWPSMVTLHNRGSRTSFCGGTVIDGRWVLTAAHCVVGDPSSRNLVIREGGNLAGGGREIGVTNIIVHSQFRSERGRLLNDIALLQLSASAQAPRQQLLRNSLRSEYLRDGVMGTVIGYGRTGARPPGAPASQSGSGSDRLLQVDIPLVSQERCARQHGPAYIGDGTVCAGTEEGGKDSCNGDSGGPLFVRSPLKESVQAGIVSYGPGCASPGVYGVYSSVAHFEDWIRQRVPNASFINSSFASASTAQPAQGGTDQSLASIVGSATTGQPSQLAQITVDLKPGERVKVGDVVTVRVTSSIDGNLIVYNEDHARRAYQIFPNKLSGGNLPGQARVKIAKGQPVAIPGPTDGFQIRITPPIGKNRVIAIVVPTNVRVDDIVEPNEDMRPVEHLDRVLEAIAEREQSTRGMAIEAAPPRNRAVGIREYQIVQ